MRLVPSVLDANRIIGDSDEPVGSGEALQLKWVKARDGEWFDLESAPRATDAQGWGVYVIWSPSDNPGRPGTVLKVGSGNIPIRLYLESLDPELRWFGDVRLLVTWAVVEDPTHRPWVVRYLSERLSPFYHRIVEAPDPETVPVNLPLIA